MAMTVSSRSEQINAVLSPHLPPPLTNIIISYKTMFDDEETMAALNYLVKNLSGKVKMNPSEDGYDLAIAMVNKLYQAITEENLFISCVANTEMNRVEQVELAKRYSIMNLTADYCKILHPIPLMESIVKDRNSVWHFYLQIPQHFTWIIENSSLQQLSENDLAQIVENPRGFHIRCISYFQPKVIHLANPRIKQTPQYHMPIFRSRLR